MPPKTVAVLSPEGGDSPAAALLDGIAKCGMAVVCGKYSTRVRDKLPDSTSAVVLLTLDLGIIQEMRGALPTCFLVTFGSAGAKHRYQAFECGLNMMTEDLAALCEALTVVAKERTHKGTLTCPFCGLTSLSPAELWKHAPLYHSAEHKSAGNCPICRTMVQSPLLAHLHREHAPVNEHASPESQLEMFAPFALVVVRRPSDGKFLLVQERYSRGYWLPGGHVDPGEDPAVAAVRETKEEAGIDIELKGVLRVEYTPHKQYVRMRVIFYAEPKDPNQLPKSLPDFESSGATFVTATECMKAEIPLRGSEPAEWFPYVELGGAIAPLQLFTREAAPVQMPKGA